jgi:DNA-binding GntR family transcriptional regulator
VRYAKAMLINALVQSIADGDEQNAEELMHSHLVDLNSALDLRDRAPVQVQNLGGNCNDR